MSLTTIDDDALVEILLRIDDPQTLGFSLPLTCRRLYRSLCGRNRSHFWVQKCLHDRVLLPDTIAVKRAIIEHPDFPWFQLWHKRPFGRQLLGPNLKDDEIQQIAQFARLYDGQVEEPPEGSNAIDEPARCYATSYHWGKRQMAIELKRFGLNDWLMDHVRPVIRVSEWNGARFDCASTYNFIVRLAESPRRKRKAQRYKRDTEQWNDDTWEHVEFVFKDYSAGARFLMISSEGKDRQYWAGFFGSKFTDAELYVDWPDHLPDDSASAGSSKKPDDQSDHASSSSSDDNNDEGKSNWRFDHSPRRGQRGGYRFRRMLHGRRMQIERNGDNEDAENRNEAREGGSCQVV